MSTVLRCLFIILSLTIFAKADYSPASAFKKPVSNWQVLYMGQTNFNGLDVLVCLEQIDSFVDIKPMPSLKVRSYSGFVGNAPINTADQKAYRLAFRLPKQPEMAVAYGLEKMEKVSNQIKFKSAKTPDNKIFEFTISGNADRTLTVTYLRYSENSVVESGTFEINSVR